MRLSRTYIVGEAPRFERRFTDEDTGAAVDPSTVVAKVIEPTGIEREYVYGVDAALVRASAGVYRIAPELTLPGEWVVRFRSEGTHVSAKEVAVTVKPTPFANPFASGSSPPSENLVFVDGEQVFVDSEPVEVS